MPIDLYIQLHQAVDANNLKKIDILLQKKDQFNIDQPDNTGLTPLVLAVRSGHHDAVKLLLEAGANPNRKGNYGHIALHYARTVGIIKLLADFKSDLNCRSTIGQTPLILAIVQHRSQALDSLLKAGANPNEADDTGKTPLSHAVGTNATMQLLSVQNLLKYNADINKKDRYGMSGWDYAQRDGSPALIAKIRKVREEVLEKERIKSKQRAKEAAKALKKAMDVQHNQNIDKAKLHTDVKKPSRRPPKPPSSFVA